MKKRVTPRKIKKYGWKPSLPDIRDLKYKISAPVTLPESVDLSPNCPPVYNQLQLGGCTGNSFAAAYEYKLIAQKEIDFTPSRLFIYFNERSLEGTVKSDAGAMNRDGAKALNKLGVCDEKIWPYIPKYFANTPTNECFLEGLKHTITQYESLDNTSLYMLQQCLAKGTPFVFGFTVYESFEGQEVAATGIMTMPDNSESVLGGHSVLAVGYDNKTKMIKVRNSWGDSWGDKGYFYMPYEYITNPQLASDFWCIDAV